MLRNKYNFAQKTLVFIKNLGIFHVIYMNNIYIILINTYTFMRYLFSQNCQVKLQYMKYLHTAYCCCIFDEKKNRLYQPEKGINGTPIDI